MDASAGLQVSLLQEIKKILLLEIRCLYLIWQLKYQESNKEDLSLSFKLSGQVSFYAIESVVSA